MKLLPAALVLLLVLASCKNGKAARDGVVSAMPAATEVAAPLAEMPDEVAEPEVADTLATDADTLALPVVQNEAFSDFIFTYARNDTFQRERTLFPVPYHNVTGFEKLTRKRWQHDSLFIGNDYYTLLFDKEEDMDVEGDSLRNEVQVEWIFLHTNLVKEYHFKNGRHGWMLNSIRFRPVQKSQDDDFLTFYLQFATDSVFQRNHIHSPLKYVTIDPEDEFSILETTMEKDQWFAFRPTLPIHKLSNIDYGQDNEDLSETKILKLNGINNGFSNVLYFKKYANGWALYKFEDTSI